MTVIESGKDILCRHLRHVSVGNLHDQAAITDLAALIGRLGTLGGRSIGGSAGRHL